MKIRIKYIDSVGREVGYWGSFPSLEKALARFEELRINVNKIIKLEVAKYGEEYKELSLEEWLRGS